MLTWLFDPVVHELWDNHTMDKHSSVSCGSFPGINQGNVMRGLTPRNVSPQKYKVYEKVETYADVIKNSWMKWLYMVVANVLLMLI